MALEPGPRRSLSPDSSGPNTPIVRQWRNQLGAEDTPIKDKHYRKYASGVERALSLFDTALEEWADYISFLSRLLKALQARQTSTANIPSKTLVAKRLSQCLNPSLPSGVHQKALEVYSYVFSIIGKDGLSRDLPLYLPGLAPTLSFASLTVRAPFLDLLEQHVLHVDPRSLRPAMKSIILALLPGLEDETSEDFDRTLKILESFKVVIRPSNCRDLTATDSTGDDFFWQCFFLATITSQSRRPGALAYLARKLPILGHPLVQEDHSNKAQEAETDKLSSELSNLVTSPEPGLLLRCFASGLGDEQLLIQRGFLDLLVTHLPLHSKVLQKRVKSDDLELLLRAAAGVVTRRDMSLNRRLWAWFLGPDPPSQEHENGLESPNSPVDHHGFLNSKTSYFEEYGLQPLTRALLAMINSSSGSNPVERARPYRICLSLMDRWEIGGLVVPEIFLPVIESVKDFKSKASSKAEFNEVLRSASVFFDGVESGLIYGEIIGLMAQAIGPGNATNAERNEKFALVQFIMTHFNVREEEMVSLHAPLAALSILAMLEEVEEHKNSSQPSNGESSSHSSQALDIARNLVELIPQRAFPTRSDKRDSAGTIEGPVVASTTNSEMLKKIQNFYVSDQGNLEATPMPFASRTVGALLAQKACSLTCDSLAAPHQEESMSVRSRLLGLLLSKIPYEYTIDTERLLSAMQARLTTPNLPFVSFKSILFLSTQLYTSERIPTTYLSNLVEPLVRHAWSFLSLSEPKYHVEAVRCLWQLQTALTTSNRDIEAVITDLMLKDGTTGTFSIRPADPGRSFTILWSHTLQDNPSHSDRRISKAPTTEFRPTTRLAGMDHYDVMLTRPLFLMLDCLLDERTQLFMMVKNWLNTMIGIDKLFLIFVTKISQLRFLRKFSQASNAVSSGQSIKFEEEDDVELALYYLRTLSNIFRWAPDAFWGVLATSIIEEPNQSLIEITGTENSVSLQEFFLRVCMRCIAGNQFPDTSQMPLRVAQLHRCALTFLHQILLNPFAETLSRFRIEDVLIDRLAQSLGGPDPYIQVLLLDVIFASLKLRDASPAELPSSPAGEKRSMTYPSGSLRLPLAPAEHPHVETPPPAALLNCIKAGLSAPCSRPVLDSWVGFLAECLPLYSDSIFQVLIPLVETLCGQVASTFSNLQTTFKRNGNPSEMINAPESTLISLLNALEQVLAKAHDQLLAAEARAQVVKSPDQPQGFFGNMVSGVFNSDAPQSRSATANDRLTVLLAFQDAVRMCFKIWSWGQGSEAGNIDMNSASSFNYTSLRMRNRARRLLEHVFAAEALECLETVVDIWRTSLSDPDATKHSEVFNLLPALDGSRPRHTIPAIFNAIYSRTNPGALETSRKSTLTVELQDTDLVIFLVDYTRSLEDDTMDEIWQDCMIFLKDLLGNPFPHRQTLPSLLEFAAILGEKVDNTNFGEQRKMRRELGDLFLRLLTAIFTTRPASFSDGLSASQSDRSKAGEGRLITPADRADDIVGILSHIVPNLPKILVESDRVLTAAGAISTNVIGPSIRSKAFPDTISKSALTLLQELTRLPGNQKTWKKDIGDAFNDSRFFNSSVNLVRSDWLPLLKLWTITDKDRMAEILSRITPPTTAGIVFGVGATSARLEADRKTQLNLRRIAALVLACGTDTFVTDLPIILERIVELLAATSTSSPSSTTRADIYMVVRALVLRTSAIHLAPLWPIVNAELHAAMSSVAAPDNSASSDTFSNMSVLQACKLLDLLIAAAPDDFQLHEWLFVTDTIDAIYRSTNYQPVALVDELSEELGNTGTSTSALQTESAAAMAATNGTSGLPLRRPLLGHPGGINDELAVDRKDELVAKILRPFFGQLSIYAFESTYAMGALDTETCVDSLLKDLFDERTIVKAL
ncbi:Dopey, N-terminal-domain-containing protein [Annulohypoxylon truncatum]|uniref:Dopey, N-terminal-domain-containing protein n=1 Tax=Annulohypoxylon truncatum TaxID=327061 RepID=UPI002007611E|nr:Dopey, N-terminal-domain-containing protein [Annulohypoxylon truncatum]KAI1209979.1 Dopey, N-terminal-domain-containing protein [Annulohypoxylon truncatum]